MRERQVSRGSGGLERAVGRLLAGENGESVCEYRACTLDTLGLEAGLGIVNPGFLALGLLDADANCQFDDGLSGRRNRRVHKDDALARILLRRCKDPPVARADLCGSDGLGFFGLHCVLEPLLALKDDVVLGEALHGL